MAKAIESLNGKEFGDPPVALEVDVWVKQASKCTCGLSSFSSFQGAGFRSACFQLHLGISYLTATS